MDLPKTLPKKYKKLQHPWLIAFDFETRNPSIAYYIRMHILNEAIKVNKVAPKSNDPAEAFPFNAVFGNMEMVKKQVHNNVPVIGKESESLQEFELAAVKLIGAAEKLDNARNYDRKIVKMYFTSSILFDCLPVFNNYDNKHADKSTFAKWRATYIADCLKKGEIPDPPNADEDDDDFEAEFEKEFGESLNNYQTPTNMPGPSNSSILPKAGASNISSVGPTSSSSLNRQNVQNPYPNINQTGYPPVNNPAPNISRPTSNSRVTPENQFNAPSQRNTQVAQLSYAQTAKAKEILKESITCLDFDDVIGAINIANKAINYMRTGKE